MENINVSSCHCSTENYDFSSTTTKTMMGVLLRENSSAREGVKEENIIDFSSPCGTEKNDFSSTITTTTTTEVLVRGDSADRNFGNEENAPDADLTTLTTQIPKQCATAADKNSSPSPLMQQENKAPATKTPTAMSVQPLKHQVPFRERNMEEGKRVLPPHIKVPPKKMFGYPERYRSPTDAMVSPVSRGLLTRNRRPARTLAPVVPPKALENTFQDVVVEAVAESETH